jgi:predicted AlkP superfamily phosphohydrolase/phosphomutase
MIAVDGLTPETVTELRAQGKLPEIDRLIRRGAWGPMESLAARRRLRPRPKRGYWSPIIWASMATGKVPDKHGIVDFLLPVPGTTLAWVGSDDGPPHATLNIPELAGTPPHELRLRLRSYRPNGSQDVTISMNRSELGAVSVGAKWVDRTVPIPSSVTRPAQNQIDLAFERQSRPSDHGPSKDRRPLAGALASLQVMDANGTRVVDFDPIYERFSLVRGFHQPEAKVIEAGSGHMRAKPVWSLLGESGHPVGVVGYWNTWPAYEVNGFLISSHMGVRGKRQNVDSQLTWPPELQADIASFEPDAAAMARLTRKLYPESCEPIEKLASFERILCQDAFYFQIARAMLPTMERGFFTVYFESIDASGHLFLPLKHGAELPSGCPESVRDVVDKTYVQLDAWVGELVRDLPDHAIVMLVSDHGMAHGGERGLHAPFGVFLAAGGGFRKGAETRGMTVLDVAPTVMHALGEPVPLDMDGKVGVSSFDAAWLDANPPRYVDTDTSLIPLTVPTGEVSEEMLERLRVLGYVQ